MLWQFCKVCGKVVDEYEDKCYWCGSLEYEDSNFQIKNQADDERQLKLFEV